eukprot:TRINITY_DN6615_c0_g1_i1.p1 TRINITY_DN6615_c0_g1~~TRINITY_DN6615_c0_g1_i1.p1  ORF type:complete len:140 (+),score=21.25 TRINITY_DN6615_c0_g1_i1:69-488(+)
MKFTVFAIAVFGASQLVAAIEIQRGGPSDWKPADPPWKALPKERKIGKSLPELIESLRDDVTTHFKLGTAGTKKDPVCLQGKADFIVAMKKFKGFHPLNKVSFDGTGSCDRAGYKTYLPGYEEDLPKGVTAWTMGRSSR